MSCWRQSSVTFIKNIRMLLSQDERAFVSKRTRRIGEVSMRFLHRAGRGSAFLQSPSAGQLHDERGIADSFE